VNFWKYQKRRKYKMKRKVFMALAIGAGCCLITGNVLMAQPSVPQWEYVEQTDDGMLVFRMGEIELKVPEDWEDSYVRKEKDGGEAFYLKNSDEKEKNELFWLKDSEGLQALWDEEYRAQWDIQEDGSASDSQKTEGSSEETQSDSQEQENQNSDDNSDSTGEQENVMSQTGFNGCYLYGEDGKEVYVEQSEDGNWYDENGVCYGSREEIDDAGENGDPVTNENGETYYWTTQE
jgi:hypothetical protein